MLSLVHVGPIVGIACMVNHVKLTTMSRAGVSRTGLSKGRHERAISTALSVTFASTGVACMRVPGVSGTGVNEVVLRWAGPGGAALSGACPC